MAKERTSGSIRVVKLFGWFALLVAMHVSLSYYGFVPSEVERMNSYVLESVQSINTVTYERANTADVDQNDVDLPTTAQNSSSTRPNITPAHISIPRVDVSSRIITPSEVAVEVLDAALQDGVVHYPGSGAPGGEENMFLFGHSSRLEVVYNDAYKVFNGLNTLTIGDEIIVTGSDGLEYRYEVSSVRLTNKDEALVEFGTDGPQLTLSTCNSFGEPQERIVVEASFVSKGDGV